MLLARVDGYATFTLGHASLRGQKLVLCTPVDETGAETGAPVAAIDPIGAGRHARVYVSTDGYGTQKYLNDFHSPVRNQITGLVDPS